jgi:hypothetical protein
MGHYPLAIQVTDPTPGWKLGARVLPHRYLVHVRKLARFDDDGRPFAELSPSEVATLRRDGNTDPYIGEIDWLTLEIESDPTRPPRCVALRAPRGISTPEQRFPLAGIVTEASAAVASRDGSFLDPPQGLDYDDARFEVNRSRGRRRGRSAITTERLEDVARVARQHPRTPTAAVQAHFRISRGYARRLIKKAEAAGLELVGTDS